MKQLVVLVLSFGCVETPAPQTAPDEQRANDQARAPEPPPDNGEIFGHQSATASVVTIWTLLQRCRGGVEPRGPRPEPAKTRTPMRARTRVTMADGRVVADGYSSTAGKFRTWLEPGRYCLTQGVCSLGDQFVVDSDGHVAFADPDPMRVQRLEIANGEVTMVMADLCPP